MPASSSRAGRTLNRVNPLPKGLCCIPCRERRVRCDGGFPCGACLRKARWDGRNLETNHLCVHASKDGGAGLGPAASPDSTATQLEGATASSSHSSDGSTIDHAPPTIHPSMLLPENTMDAFALATSSRFESAGWTHRRSVPRAPRETTKAAVASSSNGPLQKGLACLSCKQRRVKCDGLKPSCSSCVRNARWNGRDPSADHGCVYRADLPPPPLPAYLTTAALAATPLFPMAPPSTTSSSASYTPASIPSTPVEELHRSLSFERAAAGGLPTEVKPLLPPQPYPQPPPHIYEMHQLPALPPLPKALYPFRHAPESPRSLPSLYSSADDSTASSCPSPIPSPSLSPHGTPHAFFGHDLLPISYPPVPYPPADAWNNVEELALPGPAFDLARFSEFKLGGRDGWLTGSEVNEMMSVEVSVGTGESLGLGMELDGGEAEYLGGDRKRMRMSEKEGPGPTSMSTSILAPTAESALADLLAEVKKEPEEWQIQLGSCLSDEVTSGWGL